MIAKSFLACSVLTDLSLEQERVVALNLCSQADVFASEVEITFCKTGISTSSEVGGL